MGLTRGPVLKDLKSRFSQIIFKINIFLPNLLAFTPQIPDFGGEFHLNFKNGPIPGT